jgi:hypothetical protein
MYKSCFRSSDSGSLLLETAIALPMLLLIIVATANIGSIIWEATVYSEANRSASRTASLMFYDKAQCGQNNDELIISGFNQYIKSFQSNNKTSGKDNWNMQPRVIVSETSWKGDRRGTNDLNFAPNVNLRFGMIIVGNNSDKASCKYCLSGLQGKGFFDFFNIRTVSVFQLPDACAFGNNPEAQIENENDQKDESDDSSSEYLSGGGKQKSDDKNSLDSPKKGGKGLNSDSGKGAHNSK